jgi:hypothetical protein
MGCTEAREFTPPLRPLTRQTTLGYELADFADLVLGEPLLPWQRWLAIHALELLPDGTPRFRTVVVLVARQNGKSHFARVLTLYFLFMRGVKLVLGTAQSLDIARVLWKMAVLTCQTTPDLRDELIDVRRANGQEAIVTSSGGQYCIAASNESAGRGLSVDLLLCDEIRQQKTWKGWQALSKTTMARPLAQIWALSNAGESDSVVLNSLEESARSQRDPSIGLFAYTTDPAFEIDDPQGWRQANPALGVTISEAAIRGYLATDPPAVFRTEVLCQRVDALDTAIDLSAWKDCQDPMGTMPAGRRACGIDVAPDGQHVTLVVAAEAADGRIRIEVADAWKSTAEARKALPALLAKIKPVALGWLPVGPAAPLGADLRKAAIEAVELTGAAVTESCQELADLVTGRRILHSSDPLLDAHVNGSKRLFSGDGWRFVRRGAGHVDAAYAAAAAVHVLRNLPAPKPELLPMAV